MNSDCKTSCNGIELPEGKRLPIVHRWALSGYTTVLLSMAVLSVVAAILASLTIQNSDMIPLSNRRLQLSKYKNLLQQEAAGPRRVAICFFGLTRSLSITMPSIRTNLIGPIQRGGYEVDLFLHTYSDVAHLTNPRTGEDTDLNLNEWKMLSPYDAVLTKQAIFQDSVRSQKEECMKRGTGWPTESDDKQLTNVENILAQLNSIFEVGNLMEKHHVTRQYSAVLFARPDVNYSCPFPIEYLGRVKPNIVYTPAWGQYNGFNDRFALMTPTSAMIWKRRKYFSLHECKTTPIHAERYLPVFLNAMGLKNEPLRRFGFVRVRSNGEFSDLDMEFTQLCQDA